jgi:hypothetical protein
MEVDSCQQFISALDDYFDDENERMLVSIINIIKKYPLQVNPKRSYIHEPYFENGFLISISK